MPNGFRFSLLLRSLAVALGATILAAAGWVEPFELPLRDAILRLAPRPAGGRLVAVVVDEASIARLGPWPWPRERLAGLVDRCRRAGAKGVALDLLLAEPAAGDDRLAASLAEGPSLLASALGDDGRWILPVPALAAAATPVHAELERDGDGVLRRIAGTKQAGGRAMAPLAAMAATLAGWRGAIPVGGVMAPAFRTPPGAMPTVSAAELLGDGPRRNLDGTVVLVGAVAAGLGDRVPVATSPRGTLDAGVLVHAAAAESLLAGDRLRKLPPIAVGLLAALLTLLARRAARGGGGRRLAAGLLVAIVPLALVAPALLLGHLVLPAVLLSAAAALPLAVALARADLFVFGRSARALEGLGGRELPASTEERVRRLSELSEALERGRRDEADDRRLLAHELKTPLGSVRGLSQLLAGYELDEEERRHVAGLVGQETGRLAAMVERLLAIDRLELRDLSAEAEPLDLARLVAARVELVRTGRGAPVSFEATATVRVRGVAPLLEQAVDNLVENALRYSPAGSPVVVRVGADRAEGFVEVEDRGAGIPESERETIFRRFHRGSTARGTEGLGLGLAFVAEVASRHGGRATVEPASPNGSRFRLVVPGTRSPAAGC